MLHSVILVVVLLTDISRGTVVHEISDAAGVLKSPGYPGDYGDNVDITWKFRAKPGYKFRLVVEEFDIEDSSDDSGGSCARDYLEVSSIHLCDICNKPRAALQFLC